jgi:4-hydroxy-tetrahydrodipicolinate reductase
VAEKIRVALIGAKGRLGQSIAEVAKSEASDRVSVSATIDRENSSQFAKLARDADVFLDVSAPAATERFLKELLETDRCRPYVIGNTGWSDSQLKTIHAYARKACLVLAPNFAPAVNLFLGLIEQAAHALGNKGYDISIHETHHTKKLDAPSGTAKAMLERLGSAGSKAQVHSTRAASIVGTHEIRFVGPGDVLTLTHEALDRKIFARGAILAAEWAARQPATGLYSMKEVVFGVR